MGDPAPAPDPAPAQPIAPTQGITPTQPIVPTQRTAPTQRIAPAGLLGLGEGVVVAAEGDDAHAVAERAGNRGERGKRGERPSPRRAGPDHGGDAQHFTRLGAPAGVEDLAVETGGDLGDVHAVHGSEQIAEPVGLGEEQKVGQGAVGEQGAIEARGLKRREERLVVLHVVGAEQLGALAGEPGEEIDGGILGGDEDVGVADGVEEAGGHGGVADPGNA